MKHSFIIKLLEDKRISLNESVPSFSRRLFADLSEDGAESRYFSIRSGYSDFPEKHIPAAATILGIDPVLLSQI